MPDTPPTPPPTSDGRGERLGAIRARAEAATPGPWEAIYATVYDSQRGVIANTEDFDSVNAASDSTFIAHAREDIPYLLAALTMEPDELARLRAAARPFAHCERTDSYDYTGYGPIDCAAYVEKAEKARPDEPWWCTVYDGPCNGCILVAALTTATPEPTDVPDEREG